MKPVIALVGRPNVGKSTLFNCLTRSRDAIVSNYSGLTRDRKYGQADIYGKSFIVIDTGGVEGGEAGVDAEMFKQTELAIDEAHVVLFIVDAHAGLTPIDEVFAKKFRAINKPVFLILNKIDGVNPDVIQGEFYKLGLGDPLMMAAAHNRGVQQCIESLFEKMPELDLEEDEALPDEGQGIRLAIVGKPNVGKSTLVNRILGEERVVVYDLPGTTRDSIFIPMNRNGQDYTLIDTAGIRRKKNVHETIEKFSVIKALQAIDASNVVVLVIDAREGVTDQDLHLLGYVLESGRSLLIAINKWDGLEDEERTSVKRELDRRLTFVDFAKTHFISALHGTGVGNLFGTIDSAFQSATKRHSTPFLTKLLQQATTQHAPPTVSGRRIKLRYAHAGGYNPPRIVIHGNQTDRLTDEYKRYLSNFYRKSLKCVGTPIHLEFNTSKNPFEGLKNKLSPGQIKKKRRLMRFVKKKKK